MNRNQKQVWATRGVAAMGILAGPIGITVGKLHLVGPNPGTFFALGVAATLSLLGISYGLREALRIVRPDDTINH